MITSLLISFYSTMIRQSRKNISNMTFKIKKICGIKLSKRNTKGKKLRRKKKKNQNFNGDMRNNTSRLLHNMNSRSAVRQILRTHMGGIMRLGSRKSFFNVKDSKSTKL